MEKTIWEEIVESGVEFDHHYSDLYIPVNDTTTEILNRHGGTKRYGIFKSRDGSLWYDVPFAYLPFWDSNSH
jgi:hypothetical protein